MKFFFFYIASVGHFENLLVPSYNVTFGAVGTCALVIAAWHTWSPL